MIGRNAINQCIVKFKKCMQLQYITNLGFMVAFKANVVTILVWGKEGRIQMQPRSDGEKGEFPVPRN